MSSHASRVWITSATVEVGARASIWARNAASWSPRSASGCSRSRTRSRRPPTTTRASRASASSSSHSAAEPGGVVGVEPDGRPHVGLARGERRRARATTPGRCPRRPPPSTPAARAAALECRRRRPPLERREVAVAVDPGHRRPAGVGRVPGHEGSSRGKSGAPFSSGDPAGRPPHAAASGSRWSGGLPAQPEPAPELGGGVRDQRRREQRDDRAAPRGSRRAPRRPRRCRPPC